MKICDLTQSYTTSSGGIKAYIESKRDYIKKYSNDNHILIVPGKVDKVEKNNRFSTYQVAAPLVPGCEPYRFIYRLDKILRILKTEQPDIIELGSAYLLPWAVFVHNFFYRCKIIGYYHTDFPTAYIKPVIKNLMGTFWGTLAEKLTREYANFIYKRCHATITSSRIFRHLLIHQGIPNLKYIPLGVNIDLFHPRKRSQALRKKFGIRENDLLLIYAGRIDAEKRVEQVLDTFKQLPEHFRAKLFLIGEGPLKIKLQENTSENHNIVFLPYQNQKENLANFLASADIYVTAGPHETFGLSIIEAQASGLPVVGVNAGALIDRVKLNVGILAKVDSPTDIANKIKILVKTDFREKGRNARELVEENFSWDNTFYQIFELYKSLLHQTDKQVATQTDSSTPITDLANQKLIKTLIKFQKNYYNDP